MSRIRLYIDEDAMDTDLVNALRLRGVDTLTVRDAGMIRQPDEAQLRFASQQGRALYSSMWRTSVEYMQAGSKQAHPTQDLFWPGSSDTPSAIDFEGSCASSPPNPLRSCENVSSSSMCGPKNMADAARSGRQANQESAFSRSR